jgi:hypothetical protein
VLATFLQPGLGCAVRERGKWSAAAQHRTARGAFSSLSASIAEPACGIRECPGYLSVLACLRSEGIAFGNLSAAKVSVSGATIQMPGSG